MADKGMAFEFLDVGMGDSTLIQLPPWDSGLLWLADFGERGSPFKKPVRHATRFLVNRITEVCKNRKLANPTVDFLTISHADGDHWNKLDWIIKGYTDKDVGLWEAAGWPNGTTLKIGTLIFGGDWEGDYESRDWALANTIWNAKSNLIVLGECDRDPKNDMGEVKPRVWYRNKQDPDLDYNIYLLNSNRPTKGDKDCNPKSLVWMFEYQTYKVIITGDAESGVAEPAMLEYYPQRFLQSYALKLGHHGSAASTSQEWADAVQPSVIFASGDRRWGHPYCDPILRCEDYIDTLSTKRWYACSGSGSENDYESTNTDKAICPNLWYVVTGDAMTWEGPDGDDHTEEKGAYFGVQYRLQIDPTGQPHITNTDQWPAPNQSSVLMGDALACVRR